MADPAAEPTLPHAAHDPLLIAALTDGDAGDPDGQRAEALVAACPDCAALAADLRAIALATAALAGPGRPRDFRLSPADAERLRPRGLRGLAGALGRLRLGGSQPFAAGLTMLGLTGLLVTTLSFGAGTPSAATGSVEGGSNDVRMFQAPAPTVPSEVGIQAAPQLPSDRDINKQDVRVAPAPQPATDVGPRLAVAAGSAVAAFAGLALFLAGRERRRLR